MPVANTIKKLFTPSCVVLVSLDAQKFKIQIKVKYVINLNKIRPFHQTSAYACWLMDLYEIAKKSIQSF